LKVFVHGPQAGGRLVAEKQCTAVIVDALRASATIASLFEHGVAEVLVVEHTAQAFAQKRRHPGAVLVGERGGVMIEGFDLGNSPLTAQPPVIARADKPVRVVFTSSNCSRCCLLAAGAGCMYLGSTVTASAVAGLLGQANGDVVFIPAGAAEDEARLVLEDYLACGVLIDKLGPAADPANDGAVAALALYRALGAGRLGERFAATDNGRRLTALGFGRDVRLAAQLDLYSTVPRHAEVIDLPDGGRGVVLVGERSSFR